MDDVQQTAELPRELTLLDSTMVNVGSIIGSGIFIVPATIALQLQASSLVVLVWIVGGIVTLFGALSVAELGSLMPRAGGQYVYLKEAYGSLWGFLYGWAAFLVINTASIAAVAVTCAIYLGYFFPLSPLAIKLIAIASIVLLTLVNCFGIRIGALVQNGFTLLKIGSLIVLALCCFLFTGGSVSNFSPILPHVPLSSLAGVLGLALISVLWAYDGWIEITYVAGEVKDPQRILPRALILSTIIVILSYAFINLGYLYTLSMVDMSHSSLVASDSALRTIGTAGAVFVSVAVIVSTFGANNGFIFTSPRIYYAMAREGLFFKWLATIHPKYRTPIPSLIAQAVLSIAFILSGTYDQLITYVVFASWIFYAMSAGGVMILRKRSPALARPYKTWGYPMTPVVFILFALWLVTNAIMESPRDSLVGVGIILLGIPAYGYWRKQNMGKQSIASEIH